MFANNVLHTITYTFLLRIKPLKTITVTCIFYIRCRMNIRYDIYLYIYIWPCLFNPLPGSIISCWINPYELYLYAVPKSSYTSCVTVTLLHNRKNENLCKRRVFYFIIRPFCAYFIVGLIFSICTVINLFYLRLHLRSHLEH